jgi:tRNA threonylcarbamoyladenosine biosynthesis protein TsaE
VTQPGPLVARTKSPEDTRAVGGEVSALARVGDIMLLAGDLGTGKTAFAQGLARGLGVTDPVTSPTFTLVRPYRGRIGLLHADLYRLDNLLEVVDLALLEQLEDQGACAAIEWGDLAVPVLPADFLEVRLAFTEADDERLLRFRSAGQAWAARRTALERVLDRWLVDPRQFEP